MEPFIDLVSIEEDLRQSVPSDSPGWSSVERELFFCREDPTYVPNIAKEGPEHLSLKERVLHHCQRRADCANVFYVLIKVENLGVAPTHQAPDAAYLTA
jgi:hypothetical protein